MLIQRLIAYKQFKGAAAALGARMEAESRMHPRVAGPDPEFMNLMPDYLSEMTLRGLAVASVDRVTISKGSTTFRDLLDGEATVEQVVATFLAILELAKRGSVTLEQDENFGTITIDRVEGAPAYQPGESLAIEED